MSDWRGAWLLAKHDLRMIRWKHLYTLACIAYLLLFLVPVFGEGITEGQDRWVNWTLDFVFFTILPCLGVMSNQSMGFNFKSNNMTKKLAEWRTMPISLRQIALGRLLVLVINLVPAISLFFILQYIVLRLMGVDVDALSFALHGLFWIGYALAASIVYVYHEQCYSAKAYFIFSGIVTFSVLAITTIYTHWFRLGIVLRVYNEIRQGGWWLSVIGILVGVVAFRIGVIAIEKRLRSRQFTD